MYQAGYKMTGATGYYYKGRKLRSPPLARSVKQQHSSSGAKKPKLQDFAFLCSDCLPCLSCSKLHPVSYFHTIEVSSSTCVARMGVDSVHMIT